MRADVKIPFFDLRVTDPAEREAILRSVGRVLDHGRIVLGPEVQELEQRVASLCGRKFAVGVGSGSDALLLSLLCMDLRPGDEVITTAFSWIATANAIRLAGGTPVFADIGDDLNLDPASLEPLITPRTKGIMPVHYTGKVCRMSEIQEIANRHGLWVLEDAAQAFGARKQGRVAGSFGVIAAFSMNPMKVFAACGEAGMITTDREDLHERLLALRYNGTLNREICVEASHNARLDTLQAGVLLTRLERLEASLAMRRGLAQAYSSRLAGLVKAPLEAAGEWDVYYTYTIQTDRRDELMAYLESKGIETKIRHPILMPSQPAYRESAQGRWDHAEQLLGRILCLPIHDKLTHEDVAFVSGHIAAFFAS